MEQRLTVDAIRTIDNVLYSNTNGISFNSQSYIDAVKPVRHIAKESNVVHNEYSEDQLTKWIEEAAEVMAAVNTQLTFKLHEETGRQHIQLVERGTQKVLREIPPEKMLDVIAGIWKWAGIAVDRTE